MEKVGLGTTIKLNVHLETDKSADMDNMEFVCDFYVYPDKVVTRTKNEMRRIDAQNYVATVDTAQLTQGELKMRYRLAVEDEDFDDNERRDVSVVSTGVYICR